jgi:hypothetical protein
MENMMKRRLQNWWQKKYNTEHYEIRIGFDNLVNDIEKILSNYGEPFLTVQPYPATM